MNLAKRGGVVKLLPVVSQLSQPTLPLTNFTSSATTPRTSRRKKYGKRKWPYPRWHSEDQRQGAHSCWSGLRDQSQHLPYCTQTLGSQYQRSFLPTCRLHFRVFDRNLRSRKLVQRVLPSSRKRRFRNIFTNTPANSRYHVK